MSDTSQGEGWWIASDDKWYPPESHPDYVAPAPHEPAAQPPTASPPSFGDTITPSALPTPRASPPTLGQPGTSSGPSFGAPTSPATLGGLSGPPSASETQTFGQTPSGPDFGLSTQPAEGSSRKGLIIGGVAIILVAALGFLVFRLVSGGGESTGANSPEDVVNQMIAAVNDREVVGLAELFDPDEVDAWIGSFEPFASRFAELQPDDDTAAALTEAYKTFFDAFDLSMTGLDGADIEFTTEELDPDGRIMAVRVDGLVFELKTPDPETKSIVVGAFGELQGVPLGQIDGLRVEMRDTRNGVELTADLPDGTRQTEFLDNAHLEFVTVQKDGEWYLNVGYTALRLANTQTGELDNPDYGRAYRLVESKEGGADSPPDALRDFLTALEDLNYEEMIRLTDPLSLPYLHDYQRLIDEQVDQRDRREAAADLDLRFETVELGESEWAGRTLVTVEQIAGRAGGGTFSIDSRTWCVEAVSPEGERQEGCLEEAIAAALELLNNFEDDPRDFIPDELGLVVVERNGRWFLDPLGSVGFLYDQAGEAAFDLFEDQLRGAGGFASGGNIIAVPAPLVGRGGPVTTPASPPTIGVALDLDGFEEVSANFSTYRVALAHVTGPERGRFYSDDSPFDGDDWVAVYSSGEADDAFFPAIAVTTDGDLTVELEDIVVYQIGEAGFDGRIDDQGRPQILVFGDALDFVDVSIDGVAHQVVFAFGDSGTVISPDDFGFSSPTSGSFTVVLGDPGDEFSVEFEIEPRIPSPTPVQTPDVIPTPPPFDTPPIDTPDLVTVFETYVSDIGFAFSFETAGGYFDGCGPVSPDGVTTYAYESDDGRLALITPYPSVFDAQDAYFQLFDVTSPCEGFDDLNVLDVVEVDINQIQITYDYVSDPTPQIEHYILVDDFILVAYGEDALAVAELVAYLEGF